MDRELHGPPEATRGLTLFRIMTGLRTAEVPEKRDAGQSEPEDPASTRWSDSAGSAKGAST
jgi:hypothetical protein